MTQLSLNAHYLKQDKKTSPTVELPTYTRQLKKRIVHIGVGGFHRAHQANYLHMLLQSKQGSDWGICGLALMPADTKLYQAMQAQDCLYSLWETDQHAQTGHVIGSIMEFIDATDDSHAAHAVLIDPATKIVSLTITEKGYYLNASGKLDLQSLAISSDLRNPEKPRSAIGILVKALHSRWQAGGKAFTVMSCDNLLANGDQAREAITSYAMQWLPALAEWIRAEVCFPLSMVDRITPATVASDAALISNRWGVDDQCLLICEPWSQWILEDHFSDGRPAYELAGVTLSAHVHRYEEMKVGLLNGSHSALSHIGLLMGYELVDQAAADPEIHGWLVSYMQAVQDTLSPLPDIDYSEYCRTLIARFRNPAIKDRLLRLAEDSSSKFLQCLLAPLKARLAMGLDVTAFARVIAVWIWYLNSLHSDRDAYDSYRDTSKDQLISLAKNVVGTLNASEFIAQVFKLEGSELALFAEETARFIHAIKEAGSVKKCLYNNLKASY
ncbi:mannitol dehydrogenase family protein [Zhongshania aquimaris]|uniref:Mannitol dehydrogenase family protein n=1 Tax=Zhongshania aquimaris TaxID=2857107 RepID=A0ABS6VWE9_9GAMM|nr:mannitol dehydrogenase family protein [Zhongshania aquimaris]MBW2942643.1 mannitol dehydrogenase family protein [Zhongshania aquimaris]